MPRSKAFHGLADSKRLKYANTGEASRELDGLLSAGQLRDMALKGEIPGAIKVRQRVLIPRYALPNLVTELMPEPRPIHRPQASTFDQRSAV